MHKTQGSKKLGFGCDDTKNCFINFIVNYFTYSWRL